MPSTCLISIILKKPWVKIDLKRKMKKIICYIALSCIITTLSAQDFKNNISQAQTHYTTGKLQDAHFALQQMMQDLDITIGKEVLKLFPLQLDTLSAINKQQEVFGNSQFTGVTIEKIMASPTRKLHWL